MCRGEGSGGTTLIPLSIPPVPLCRVVFQIAQVGIVFVHSSRADTGTLFVGDSAPLSRSDPRLRRIPFPTRRPTLAEVKRVAVSLASVWELEPGEPFPPRC